MYMQTAVTMWGAPQEKYPAEPRPFDIGNSPRIVYSHENTSFHDKSIVIIVIQEIMNVK